ncbi:tRNA (N6-threonylcarbamoyladenosine(37)-N6)-methyltransferase TrmO [Pseudenhygromyxa sp. WMMC2535]|uniref:tRNA (N6-threonylcarbamoyladenosine(37)-N6)-methyltransferase TrmO n=1 Tax=Pseudenhygromyxa sp. WMMC2535 TaxID=2712867 RepID=UPI0015532B2F|nr:tRNA (N6-threonylcarbamoyladenosine(37)-N6)-methyltransferase TrmO [Pseudenhygromyxa sp. WMMC2535]NVB42324.1 tRNA (N6-threonylcarbamoyladenosine(37)-N6)-methyltransferase TrmO [Pseudenhygromyxa sp. WMMC2535]
MIGIDPVGVVRSPWPEKFGVPRQSGLALAESVIVFDRERIPAEALRGLEGVSHIWVIAWMHAVVEEGWRPTVRPPRLGGAARLGVFATRSPHRPNPISLSLVELLVVEDDRLYVSGCDLVDHTPVLDIKPYLPWAESRPDAHCEWAREPPLPIEVHFRPTAEHALSQHPRAEWLRELIVTTLRWDPRPAHQRNNPTRSYGAVIADVNLRFEVEDGVVWIFELTTLDPQNT